LPRPNGLAMTAQGDTPEIRHPPTSPATPHLCHCEERSDAAIQRTASGNPQHRSGIPHHASDWIATSVLFETFLAMTALGQASENWDEPPCPFAPHLVIARRASARRGNPAEANHPRHSTTLSSAMFLHCHCEEGVSLTRQSSGPRPATPRIVPASRSTIQT
jgi:hypothetical protein